MGLSWALPGERSLYNHDLRRTLPSPVRGSRVPSERSDRRFVSSTTHNLRRRRNNLKRRRRNLCRREDVLGKTPRARVISLSGGHWCRRYASRESRPLVQFDGTCRLRRTTRIADDVTSAQTDVICSGEDVRGATPRDRVISLSGGHWCRRSAHRESRPNVWIDDSCRV